MLHKPFVSLLHYLATEAFTSGSETKASPTVPSVGLHYKVIENKKENVCNKVIQATLTV